MHSHHEDPTWQEGGETGSVRGRRTVRRDTSQGGCVGVRRERNPMDRKNAMTLTDEQRAVDSMIRAGQSPARSRTHQRLRPERASRCAGSWRGPATDPQMEPADR
jgi:hypothetical protein